MNSLKGSPFNVTKAVDFTDQEIFDTFVEWPAPGGFHKLVDPRSPVPQMILGGKGSGRTHLLRYYSYPLQRIRAQKEDRPVLMQLKEEGYVGVFMRCEGLNASRFAGKAHNPEVWDRIFPYYMDIWLARLTFDVIADAARDRTDFLAHGLAITKEVIDLFDLPGSERQEVLSRTDSVTAVRGWLRELQREIDFHVNNAALTGSLRSVQIRATPGQLVFGIPRVLIAHLRELQQVQFVYLIDELENLSESQQRYVNTLVRYREPPVSLKLGSRLYGIRTNETLTEGEPNREGSEFDVLRLDAEFRLVGGYGEFAHSLMARRLEEAGFWRPRQPPWERVAARFELDSPEHLRRRLASNFAGDDATAAGELDFIVGVPSTRRPYFVVLRRQLQSALEKPGGSHLGVPKDTELIIQSLLCADDPLLEKANIFLLYQAWADGEALRSAAERIAISARKYRSSSREESDHVRLFGHWRTDLFAQLLRDARQDQRYWGLDNFIAMSSELPRNLLVILKSIFKWSVFLGEDPFGQSQISTKAQQAGVLQASNWFFEDARLAGSKAGAVQRSVDRVARLFAELRFAFKPVEPSLIAFAFNEATLSDEASQMILMCAASSALIRIHEGHKDKNNREVNAKYQLNSMLCPRYNLPLSRRGTIELSAKELDAIFVDEDEVAFADALNTRLARMNPPFRVVDRAQSQLPGF